MKIKLFIAEFKTKDWKDVMEKTINDFSMKKDIVSIDQIPLFTNQVTGFQILFVICYNEK